MATHLSSGQYYALILVLLFSGSLSMMGSSAIILATKKKLTSVYQRLIFSLSVADACSSLFLMIHPFLLPKGTPGMLWAFGSDQSCSVMGFFFTIFKSCVAFYSAYLSIYFLWKVRYNKTDSTFSARYEVPAHMGATVLPLALAAAGVATKSYAPRVFLKVCSLGDCEIGREDECQPQTGLSYYLAWIAGAFVILPTLTAVGCTIAVYFTVRSRLRRSSRWVFGRDGNCTDNGKSSKSGQSGTNRHLIAARTQTILYTLSFLNSVLWVSALGFKADDPTISDREGEPVIFALQFLAWLFFPLQGMVNFVVYSRPRYLEWRRAKPEETRWFAIRKALTLEPANASGHSRRAIRLPTGGSKMKLPSFTHTVSATSARTLATMGNSERADLGNNPHSNEDATATGQGGSSTGHQDILVDAPYSSVPEA